MHRRLFLKALTGVVLGAAVMLPPRRWAVRSEQEPPSLPAAGVAGDVIVLGDSPHTAGVYVYSVQLGDGRWMLVEHRSPA
jgi:hypothetical protein